MAISYDDYMESMERVRAIAFIQSAWFATDTEQRNISRYSQEAPLFLALRHALKQGDISMPRRLVDMLIVVFYGTVQYKYGLELLHLR